jgi:hypothetical protein
LLPQKLALNGFFCLDDQLAVGHVEHQIALLCQDSWWVISNEGNHGVYLKYLAAMGISLLYRQIENYKKL